MATTIEQIEKTVHDIAIYKDLDINNFESITIDTLETLEDIINNPDEEVKINTSFKGAILVKLYPEGDIECKCKKSISLTTIDINIIKNWFENNNEYETYSNGYYRIDLDNYIMIFKVYSFNKNTLFFGHVLDNSLMSKMDLLEARQQFLMRNFI